MKVDRSYLLDLLEQAQATAPATVSQAIDRVLLPHLLKRAEECDSMARMMDGQGFARIAEQERRARRRAAHQDRPHRDAHRSGAAVIRASRCVSSDHQCWPVTMTMRVLENVPADARWRLSYRKCRLGRIVTVSRYVTTSTARRWCKRHRVAFDEAALQPVAPPAPVAIGVDLAVPGSDRTVYHQVEHFDHKARASGERDD